MHIDGPDDLKLVDYIIFCRLITRFKSSRPSMGRKPSLRKMMSSAPIQRLVRLGSCRRTSKLRSSDRISTRSTDLPLLHDQSMISIESMNSKRSSSSPVYDDHQPTRISTMVIVQEWNQTQAEIDMDDWARYCM